ncbi:MAG: tetratricopeptide repeat protein [Desulfurivibrionaceae bacterium]
MLRARCFTERWPDHPFGWTIVALSLRAQGSLDEAFAAAYRMAALAPHIAEAHVNLGAILKDLGRKSEAEAAYRKALTITPDFPEALSNLGFLLHERGMTKEAESAYRQALTIKPDFPEALSNLGFLLSDTGKEDEAEAAYNEALRLKPDYCEAWNKLGVLRKKQGRPQEALTAFRSAIQVNPQDLEALNNLGVTLREMGRLDEAERAFLYALKINPRLAASHNNLGNVYREQARLDEAESAFREALAINANFAEAHNNLGSVLMLNGRPYEAEESLRRAVGIDPLHASGHHNLGNVLRNLGQLAEAEKSFRLALELNPNIAEAYQALAHTKRFTKDDPDLRHIETFLARTGLSTTEQIYAYYAAGKAYADIGDDPDLAFGYYTEGAKLKRSEFNYDISHDEAVFAAIADHFSANFLRSLPSAGNATEKPIFIVGMPRSGTTLTEQILASHPLVHGAGEREDLSKCLVRLSRALSRPYPQWTSAITPEILAEIGQDYCQSVIEPCDNVRHVTDKMPDNFRFLGIIAMALPNARIIHVQRNPMDTCLSCFTQFFSAPHPFSYNLHELGRFYRAYHQLMEHWRNTLPPGMMLELRYEDLVGNHENEIRRLLDHCGLEWHPDCLAFHTTKRPVHTASVIQVRQPLYKTSVARWKRYEKQLGPLLEALGPLAHTAE